MSEASTPTVMKHDNLGESRGGKVSLVLVRPTPAEMARLESAERSAKWIAANRSRLMAESPDTWIVVNDGKLAATGKSADAVKDKARAAGLDLSRCLVEDIAKSGRSLYF